MRLLFAILFITAILHAKDSGELLKRGNAAYSAGKLDEAMKCYDEALVESPENPHLIFNRAVVLFKQGDYEKARETFQSSIDKLPNLKRSDMDLERRARIAIGNCCFFMAKQFADSEIDNAVKLCLDSIQSYENVLRINEKDKIATKNIAASRMLLKKLLGIKYAQTQQQKQQEELGRKIKELAERQKNAADNTAKANQSSGTDELQKEQEAINNDTEQLANQLQPPQPQSQPQLQQQQQSGQPQDAQPQNPLDSVRQAQDDALEKLKSNDLKDAEGKQREAAEQLEKMLKQSEKQQQQQQQQQQQNGQDESEQKQDDGGKQDGSDDKKQDDKKDDTEEQQQESEQQQQANASEQDKQDSASEQEAQEIIDRERHDKRERDKNRRGNYRAVPMDW